MCCQCAIHRCMISTCVWTKMIDEILESAVIPYIQSILGLARTCWRDRHNHAGWPSSNLGWGMGCHPIAECDQTDHHREEEALVPVIGSSTWFPVSMCCYFSYVCGVQSSNPTRNWREEWMLTIEFCGAFWSCCQHVQLCCYSTDAWSCVCESSEFLTT